MEIELLKDMCFGSLKLLKGDKLRDGEMVKVEELNNEYVLLVVRGIRYDISKSLVKIL